MGDHGPAARLGTVEARDLRRASTLHTDHSTRYEAALAEVVEAAWLRHVSSSSDDRPRKDFAVNPYLTAQR